MWQNSIYHPTNYEMTNSILSRLTFNLTNEQMHFSYCYLRNFVIISPRKRLWPFIWKKLESYLPKMFCAMFGWYWSSGFREKVKNGKSLHTDDGRQTVRKLVWVFNSGDLKTIIKKTWCTINVAEIYTIRNF